MGIHLSSLRCLQIPVRLSGSSDDSGFFVGVFDKLCMPSCCYALPMVDRDVLASRGTFNQCHKG